MRLIKIFIPTVILLLFFEACAVKEFKYLDSYELENEVEKADVRKNYLLRPDDLIYIDFNSIDEETVALFKKDAFGGNNRQMNNSQNNQNSMMWDFMGYRIDESGNIELPLVGKVPLAGLTLLQTSDTIQTIVRQYIPDAVADVKLLSFSVEMMGQFNAPGKITTRQNYLNIMEAINQAGGISYNGDWNKVHVIRETPSGRIDYYVDVTDRDLIWTEKYYLQPHDIVIVESRPMNLARINVSDFSFVLTTITSTLTAIVLIISLNRN